MLQSRLADRFKLTLRREAKEIPFYKLTAAKGGLRIRDLVEAFGIS
jgi:uncharacterized protein (TIGR03435 family)